MKEFAKWIRELVQKELIRLYYTSAGRMNRMSIQEEFAANARLHCVVHKHMMDHKSVLQGFGPPLPTQFARFATRHPELDTHKSYTRAPAAGRRVPEAEANVHERPGNYHNHFGDYDVGGQLQPPGVLRGRLRCRKSQMIRHMNGADI